MQAASLVAVLVHSASLSCFATSSEPAGLTLQQVVFCCDVGLCWALLAPVACEC